LSTKIEPSLESITVRGKYKITATSFENIHTTLLESLRPGYGIAMKMGESCSYLYVGLEPKKHWDKMLKEKRNGVPIYFHITTIEHLPNDDLLVEVECRPAMWYKITKFKEKDFSKNDIQEALIECKTFVKQIMSIFKAKEVQPVSVYPIIPRSEIKSRLLNLGLKNIGKLLDKSEQYMIQNNFDASLTKSRTAYEKMIDYQIKKRGLKQTNNYKNDVERLRSRGYLDKETAKLLQSYYQCISNIAVHEKVTQTPSMFEAQLGYRMTITILDYFINKLP
jgi:hypothetical protein